MMNKAFIIFSMATLFLIVQSMMVLSETNYRATSETECNGGVCTIKFYSNIVNYFNGTQYTPIETNLISSSYIDYDYEVTRGLYKSYFKEDPTEGQVVLFIKDGHEITFQPMALNYRNDLNQLEQIELINPVMGINNQSRFIYPEAYGSGIDLIYNYFPTKLKESLTINQFSDLMPLPEYMLTQQNVTLDLDFIISTDEKFIIDGLEWDKKKSKTTQNEVYIQGVESNETLYKLSRPVAFDSDGETQLLTYEFKKQGNKLLVIIKTPYEWLKNASYPVNIDPSIQLSGANNTQDVLLYDSGVGNIVMQTMWDISDIPADMVIDNATQCYFFVWGAGDGLTNAPVNVTRILDYTWTESTTGPDIAVQSRANWSSEDLSNYDDYQGWSCFNVTYQLSESYKEGDKNLTIRFEDFDAPVTYTTPANWERYDSLPGLRVGDDGDNDMYFEDRENSYETGNLPYLNVSYSEAEAGSYNLTIINTSTTVTPGNVVTFAFNFTDVDGSAVTSGVDVLNLTIGTNDCPIFTSCDGSPSACSTWDADQSTCDDSGCSWDAAGPCSGSPDVCVDHGTQSPCETAGCLWSEGSVSFTLNQIAQAYSTTTETTTSETTVDMDVDNRTDSYYTLNDPYIQIDTTGWYRVHHSCTHIETTTDIRSTIESWLELDGTEVQSSRHTVYIRGLANDEDRGSTFATTFIEATAGEDLALQAQRTYGTTTSQTTDDCYMYVNHVTEPAVMMWDDTGGQTITDAIGAIDMNLDQTLLDNSSVFTPGTDLITVNEDGFYRIFYQICADQTAQRRGTLTGSVEVDGVQIGLSQSEAYFRLGGPITCVGSSFIYNISNGEDVSLRLEMIDEALFTPSFTTVADRTWLGMEQLPNDNWILAYDAGAEQTISTASSPVQVALDTNYGMNSTIFTHAADATAITINDNGSYEVTYQGSFDDKVVGTRHVGCVGVRINDATLFETYKCCYTRGVANAQRCTTGGSFVYNFTDGDYVELELSSRGSSDTLYTESPFTFLALSPVYTSTATEDECSGSADACNTHGTESPCTGSGCDWDVADCSGSTDGCGNFTYNVNCTTFGCSDNNGIWYDSPEWKVNCTAPIVCTGLNNLYMEVNDTTENEQANNTATGIITCAGGCSDTTFVVSLPGSGCDVYGTTDGSADCEFCAIVTTDTNGVSTDDEISCAGQTDGTAFYTFDNQGDCTLNLSMKAVSGVNTDKFRYKVSQSSDGWESSCSGGIPTVGCVYVETTSWITVASGVTNEGGVDEQIWAWGDYVTALPVDNGTSYVLNMTAEET